MAEIRPQPGPQERFLASPADIAILGGAAGGGKTFGLMLEPLRHAANAGFGAVIFRRTTKQIRQEGGLWDESQALYRPFGALAREQMLDWRFPSGARVTFAGMEHEQDRFAWDGAQIPLIGFDQLEHFSYRQFFYMLSRNRSACGVRPYIRATCNPDPDSFLADFIGWWLDRNREYPDPDKAGRLRWFLRAGDELIWGESAEALRTRHGGRAEPLSVTFIPATLADNPVLMAKDPGYLAKLRALPRVERERLERGNWKIRPAAGLYFQRGWFEIVAAAPAGGATVRCWDLAATEAQPGTDPDWTAGVKLTRTPDRTLFVEHVERFRGNPGKVKRALRATGTQDGPAVQIGLPQDPGQAGKAQIRDLAGALQGFTLRSRIETGDKVTRAGPFSAQAEAGNVKLVAGPWNDAYLAELENFPEGHDDQVDASAGAFRMLTEHAFPRVRSL